MRISVCMATYNGEIYLFEQLISILAQINQDDEVVIVDDCSIDNTIQIIKMLNDNRIKLFVNAKNAGHVFSFSRALSLAKNEIIFLSDQDDIWVDGRVELMKQRLLSENVCLLVSNFDILNTDKKLETKHLGLLEAKDSNRYLNNIIGIFLGKRDYYGCVMAFHRNILDLILPIPLIVKSHDLWIAMACNLIKSSVHMEEKTLIRRLHSNNLTNTHRHLLPKLWSRVIYTIYVLFLLQRLRKHRHHNLKEDYTVKVNNNTKEF